MCGIIAYTGRQDAAPILLSGLNRLEYRGYDSAGIALVAKSGIKVHKTAGKVRQLEAMLPKRLTGKAGIGHTRWATHGAPNDINAHPHATPGGNVTLVHNGIIENAAALRHGLEADGCRFVSETDTEVLAHLIERSGEASLEDAVLAALQVVEGTYGIAVVAADEPGKIVAARNGSPVIIGLGDKEHFVASDVAALVRYTQAVVYLDDGEIAVVEADRYRTLTIDARPTVKSASTVTYDHTSYERGEHAHFLHKEIFEQPEAVERALRGRLDTRFNTAHLGGLNLTARELLDVRRIKVLGCGSAYYAGIAGAHMIETLARLPATAEPAAEFRYRNPVIETDTLYVAISQSGETLDTLAAVNEVQRKGGRVLGVVNVVGSSIARQVDGGIYIHAGPETSVASTKAFTCTLVAFALLALHLGRIRDLSPQAGARIVEALQALPGQLREALTLEDQVAALARRYADRSSAFFVGRAAAFPTALEGAQKLKEISYIHAEAYPASELKHGPLALVCPDVPTVVVLPGGDLFDKAIGTVEEIRARKGDVIALTHPDTDRVDALSTDVLRVPASEPILDSVLMGLPLQLLAYHAAVALGRDVDQPRNLAKSVTVE